MLRTETMLERLAESRSCSPALGRGSTPLQTGERMSYNLFVILLSKLWVVFLWTMSISILQPMECPIKVILQEGLIKPCTQLYDFYKVRWMSFLLINDNPGVWFRHLADGGNKRSIRANLCSTWKQKEKIRSVFEVKFPRGFIARHLFFEGVSSFSW